MPAAVDRVKMVVSLLAAIAAADPAAAQTSTSFEEFLKRARAEAVAKGIRPELADRVLAGVTPDDQVIDLLNRQPEHDRTVGQYVRLLVTPERIETGRARIAENGPLLEKIQARYGVDRHVLVAIWGIETRFGVSPGDRNVVRSLATLAYGDQRRGGFWQAELVGALRILQNGDVAAEQMTGSWAGAMGHTQFMPTTYLKHAVDADGDGKRDIWGNLGDALASTANYLRSSGWQSATPWGFQVSLPAGFDYGHSAPNRAKTVAEWMALGVQTESGSGWPASAGEWSLLLPVGAAGPAFLVSASYRAILRYNASTAYALAVGLLAESLASGLSPLIRWPENDLALSRAEREELQQLLAGLGHDAGAPDGIIGSQTRTAIRGWQRSQSLPEDGHPSPELLVRLRAARN